MATPNNFKVTSAIGETDNFIGADINFYHITLKDNSASAVDVRTELGFNEAVHNVIRAVLDRGTIVHQRIDNANSGRIDIAMERAGWTAATLQTAIRDLGATVGVNDKDLRGSVVTETELKLDAS
mgnify:FL=1|jgi:uncharacterized protein GlcG (DUF336 family)|tara:strand:- start:317 stop:691 length:375 start_codon:yes stop_codon:yes gene_type:complete